MSSESETVASTDFETTPVLFSEGYLVKVDGKYGIVDLDENFVIEPIYNCVLYLDDELILMESEDSADGYNVSQGMLQTSGYSFDDGGYVTMFDGDVLSQKYYLDNETEDMELAEFFDAYVLTNVVYDCKDVTGPDFYDTASYYIRIERWERYMVRMMCRNQLLLRLKYCKARRKIMCMADID